MSCAGCTGDIGARGGLGLYGEAVQEVGTSADAGGAAAWLRERWESFQALGPAMIDLQHRAAVAGGDAKRRGDMVTHALAQQAILRLGELGKFHQRTVDRFRELGAQVPGLGGLSALPVVPLALAAAVVALAGSVAYAFARVGAEERIVRLLEAGRLDPDEAERILANVEGGGGPGAGLGDLASAAGWIAFGLGGWMLMQTLKELR